MEDETLCEYARVDRIAVFRMPYLENFDEFYAQSEALYREAPLLTRYASKYRHTDGALILKVTDDKTVRNL